MPATLPACHEHHRPQPAGVTKSAERSARSAASAATPRPTSASCSSAWLVVAVALGFFAPRVETALSGAGWEATGSQSVQARQLIDRNFARPRRSYGLMAVVHSPTQTVGDPAFRRVDRAASSARCAPTRAVQHGRRAAPRACRSRATGTPRSSRPARRATRTTMVARRRRPQGQARTRCRRDGVQVNLTGAAGMWSDFNAANRSAMLQVRGDLLAGDARHPAARVRLAGRRRAAADADDARPGRGRRLAVPRHAACCRSRSGR